MRSRLRPLTLALVPLVALLAARQDPSGAVPLAGAVPAGELAFEIRERGGGPIPARLTFVGAPDPVPELFTRVTADPVTADPGELAARRNVVYTRSGTGCITVPAGKYTLYASRGLEWSLAEWRELVIAPGERAEFRAELVHELDTPGWVNGDFHLHTLTHSGHGDASLEERVLSFLGEGLEFAVATDHNHNTDYGPTMEALGVQTAFRAVTGNEVTTAIGHFNAFPLDPARAPVDAALTDANALFRLIRAETDASGCVPVIQLNHPRWQGLDYFGFTGLDPTGGTSADPDHSRDYDSIEILNGNQGGGYHDPVGDRRDTKSVRHSVLSDWFHLLDQGQRPAAVGNSDSHHVQAIFAGYPRNYVRSASDDPARIEPGRLAAAVRAKQLFTTTGPLVEFSVAGIEMGGEARAADGHAELAVRVRAASWVDCSRVEVIVNGDCQATLAVADTRAPLRLEQRLELCLRGTCARHGRSRPAAPGAFDAWVAVLVEGDRPLFPVLNGDALPLAIANPVWVDGDGDGRWQSPRERIAAELAARPTPDEARVWFETLLPAEQALALAHVARGPFAAMLVPRGLDSSARGVRLAAARAAERTAIAGSPGPIPRAWEANRDDPYLGALLLRALVAAQRDAGPASLMAYVQRHGEGALRRYPEEILSLFPDSVVPRWQVLGPFAADWPGGSRSTGRPPASEAPQGLRSRSGKAIAWSELCPAPETGFVDLRSLGGEDTDGALVCAQAFLRAERERSVLCSFGSDDGARVWLDDRLLYENRERKSASPFEKLLTLELRPGWNRLVLEVDNGTGGFGFYCRVLDPGVEIAAKPE